MCSKGNWARLRSTRTTEFGQTSSEREKERPQIVKDGKVDNEGNAILFLNMEGDVQEEMRKKLLDQMQKYEKKEIVGNEYDDKFKEIYEHMIKKVYFINKLIFSLLPIQAEDEEKKKKLHKLVDNLRQIKKELEVGMRDMLEALKNTNRNRAEIYKKSIDGVVHS
jgi:hypothetical protein